MNKFDFKEALSFMECDMKVLGPDGNVYCMRDGVLIRYPKPVEQPKWFLIVANVRIELITSKNWSLYES
jgi:hypothetical protein